MWCVSSAGTYSQVDFAPFYDLFGKDLEEFEDTVSSFVAESSSYGRKDVFPGGHLDSKGGQGYT